MPSATGQNWEKYKKEFADDEVEEKKITPLSDEYVFLLVSSMQLFIDAVARDIQVLKTYGLAPYAAALKKLEKQIKEKQTSVNEKIGVKVRKDTFSSGLGSMLIQSRSQIPVSHHHIFGM